MLPGCEGFMTDSLTAVKEGSWDAAKCCDPNDKMRICSFHKVLSLFKEISVIVSCKGASIERLRVFTHVANIYANLGRCLHKIRVQLPQDWFETPKWPPFHCCGTPIWPLWRHVKTLYSLLKDRWFKVELKVNLRVSCLEMERVYDLLCLLLTSPREDVYMLIIN